MGLWMELGRMRPARAEGTAPLESDPSMNSGRAPVAARVTVQRGRARAGSALHAGCIVRKKDELISPK
jgi:hypothetical protein